MTTSLESWYRRLIRLYPSGHRAVYAAVGGLMETDIHALAIRARTPAEASG